MPIRIREETVSGQVKERRDRSTKLVAVQWWQTVTTAGKALDRGGTTPSCSTYGSEVGKRRAFCQGRKLGLLGTKRNWKPLRRGGGWQHREAAARTKIYVLDGHAPSPTGQQNHVSRASLVAAVFAFAQGCREVRDAYIGQTGFKQITSSKGKGRRLFFFFSVLLPCWKLFSFLLCDCPGRLDNEAGFGLNMMEIRAALSTSLDLGCIIKVTVC
jgi:hypothetical protein